MIAAHEPDAGTLLIRGARRERAHAGACASSASRCCTSTRRSLASLGGREPVPRARRAMTTRKRRRARGRGAGGDRGGDRPAAARAGARRTGGSRGGRDRARAAPRRAPILVLDEPTAVPPAREAERLLATIRRPRARRGRALHLAPAGGGRAHRRSDHGAARREDGVERREGRVSRAELVAAHGGRGRDIESPRAPSFPERRAPARHPEPRGSVAVPGPGARRSKKGARRSKEGARLSWWSEGFAARDSGSTVSTSRSWPVRCSASRDWSVPGAASSRRASSASSASTRARSSSTGAPSGRARRARRSSAGSCSCPRTARRTASCWRRACARTRRCPGSRGSRALGSSTRSASAPSRSAS